MPPPGTKSKPKTPKVRIAIARQRVVSILRSFRANHGEEMYRAVVSGMLDDLAGDERVRTETQVA